MVFRTRKAVAADIAPGAAASARFDLRLFVTGMTSRSARAIENVRATCEEFLPGRYNLQIIDLYQEPSMAQSEEILAAPTLVRTSPLPVRRIIGDMTDELSLLKGLEIARRT